MQKSERLAFIFCPRRARVLETIRFSKSSSSADFYNILHREFLEL